MHPFTLLDRCDHGTGNNATGELNQTLEHRSTHGPHRNESPTR
jgi:hypothetical protein